MTLIPIETPEDFSLAEQFVIPHEETCASLASLVRRKSDKLVFISDPSTPLREHSSILGILNLDSTIYHCIPAPDLLDADFLKAELPYLMKKPVRCISGETSGTEFLMQFFDVAAQVYPYKMMRWTGPFDYAQGSVAERSRSTGSGGEEIIRCTEHDMEALHQLQKDYMKEEVYVPGRPITDAEVDISLRQILKNQLCFALTVDGDIVAKANTNAIGINCIQIGGVYTHPLYRRNGYAGALVQALCKRASRARKQPVLFVKEKNTPAFSLYQKLGFEECGRYAIAYY